MYNPQFDTFMVTAETGSFSSAARELYITPSAVLQQVNALEDDLKVKLFIRTNRGLQLTAAGECLRQEFPKMKEWTLQLREQLISLERSSDDTLRVALPRMHKSRLFYQLWMEYTISHPEARMEFITDQTQGQKEYVKAVDDSDLIEYIDEGAIMSEKKEFIRLCDVPMAFLAGKNHPLTKKDTITEEDLKDTEICVPGGKFRTVFQWYYDRLTSYGAKILAANHFSSNVFDDAIIHGRILLVPACSLNMNPSMEEIPFEGHPTVSYGFICNRERTGVAADFIRFVQEQQEMNPVHLF